MKNKVYQLHMNRSQNYKDILNCSGISLKIMLSYYTMALVFVLRQYLIYIFKLVNPVPGLQRFNIFPLQYVSCFRHSTNHSNVQG